MVSRWFAALLCWSSVGAVSLQVSENPIRKVVTLLQDMAKEIEAEGDKEQKAFDKFMCYCDGSTDDMAKGAQEGTQKVAELSSKLEALKAEKAQLDQELRDHQSAREAAKQDATKASNLREKEHGEFTDTDADMSKNIDAMKGAIAALSKGMGSFLQMVPEQSALVQRAIVASSQVDDYEKQGVLDLLQGKQGKDYAPQSGQIVGMLKAMLDEMEGDLKAARESEASSAAGFEELSAAKASEIAAATAAIESKTKRAGEAAVEIVQTTDDIEDTEADVAETNKFLGDLDKQCASKKAEWSERQKLRADEVAAVGEAIKILNDDDALDLFKKTMSLSQTAPSMGFLQKSAKPSMALRARNVLISLAQTGRSHQTQLSLIASALKSKAVDFSKITEMIDGMVSVLGKEQEDDDAQKSFCEAEFAKSDQDKKSTEDTLASLKASLEEMGSAVETLASEISTLQSEIGSLDKAVAEATEQRKAEHEAFLTSQAENQAATQLMEKAKNRLNKFYRPNLYKEEPAEALFVQVATRAVPPPPPETFGAYQKKDGKSSGVMALMDEMINDLKAELTESKHDEETGQKDYERLMEASQKTRAANAKSITEKEGDKAEWSEKIENAKTEQASNKDALLKLGEYIQGLHGSCDFLVQNFDLRKEARTNEIEGLKNAKAVLSGANFS